VPQEDEEREKRLIGKLEVEDLGPEGCDAVTLQNVRKQ
jgi:hypothetical protein